MRTLPWDELRFSNTIGILQKKKLCGLLVLKYSKRRVHPLLKKILDPPLRSIRLKRRIERVGRSKLIQKTFTAPDVELFMNLTL